jgi:pimeloyl-ACP methyl ester carboxylesterase
MIPAERLDRMHERGRRPPRRHRTVDEAVERFRLLPPDTLAEPALLRHLAREGMVQRDGGWGVRFDPACYAERRPVDAWKLLDRITAPALIVHGERSPVLPREMAERLRDGLRQATRVEIPGAYHHLVLDRPDAFVVALRTFLETLPG